MMKVLFANSYFYRLDEKQWKVKQPYPPLATILAAAVVRERNYPIAFFDTNLKENGNDIDPVLEKERPNVFVLYDDGFNYLSKMCLTNMREASFTMIRLAKQRNAVVIVSSSDATDHAERYISAGADYIIRGEAEETLLELLGAVSNNVEPTLIPGIVYKSNDELVKTSPRSVMRDLDALPLPAWDLVDIEAYRNIWIKHHGYFSLNIATTRGCPYKCNWCAKPIYGNRYNVRSPEHVVREIQLLLETYRPDHLWMCDDIFGLKPGWIEEFNNVVHQKNLSFKYKIQSRVDLLLEKNTIKALAESGAETVWVGAESGSQKILDAMDKGTTVEQIYTATKMLRENNIKVAFFLQLGYLGETKEDIQLTIKMLLDLMPDDAGISVSYPLPGTKFYEKVKDQLKEKQNWTDSDDLAMMFKSTFQSDYYKQLHRYVHSVYRRRKGWLRVKEIFQKPGKIRVQDAKSIASIIYFGLKAMFLQKTLSKLEWQEPVTENAQLTT